MDEAFLPARTTDTVAFANNTRQFVDTLMNKSIVKQSPSRLHTYSASHFIVVNIHLPTYATASHRLSFTCTTLGVIACHERSKRMNRVRIDFFLRRVDEISTESIAVLDIVTASTRIQTSVEQ